MYMKGGKELYAYMVQSTTTLPLTPEEIHQTGLSEVTRITTEMEKVKQEVGFQGTLSQFFDHLRTDPKFKKPTREALTQGYYDIGRRSMQSCRPTSRRFLRPSWKFGPMSRSARSSRPAAAMNRARRTGRGRAFSISTPMTFRHERRRA
jgi:uncharacterized protein (DUF885 family)